jgi:hypothetical protein
MGFFFFLSLLIFFSLCQHSLDMQHYFFKKKTTFQIASLRCPQREIEIMGDLGLEQKII